MYDSYIWYNVDIEDGLLGSVFLEGIWDISNEYYYVFRMKRERGKW